MGGMLGAAHGANGKANHDTSLCANMPVYANYLVDWMCPGASSRTNGAGTSNLRAKWNAVLEGTSHFVPNESVVIALTGLEGSLTSFPGNGVECTP